MKPLFMGSSEIDQLSKVCSLMGTPTAQDWPDGVRLAGLKGYNFPHYSAIPLASVIPNCSSEAINLIGECLKWDPTKRITMNQILNHPYFKGVKIDIKPKEEERINPFDGLEKPKVSDITEHEFDAILNGFSKMASDKTP
jgi:serine/threonine protein kinase